MQTITGFNSETAQNLLLNAGAYYLNVDLTKDTPDTLVKKLIGATSGGGEFNAKPKIRQTKVDGVPGRARGLANLESWDVSMKVNLLEFRKETFKLGLGACTESQQTINEKQYTCIRGKNKIDDVDYQDNVTFMGTLSGSNEPIIIQVFNALNGDGIKIKNKDNDEIVAELTFDGYYDCKNLDVPPFAIYYPERQTVNTVQ